MTPEMILTMIVLGFAIVLFIFEWVRVDVVGIIMMALLPLIGLVTPKEAFLGLSSNAVVSIMAVIIIGSLGAGRLQFGPYGWLGPAIIVVFGLGALYLSRLFTFTWGLIDRDSLAIVIEVVVKNGLLELLVVT